MAGLAPYLSKLDFSNSPVGNIEFETNWIFNTYGLACVFWKIEHLSNIDEILTSGSLFVGIPQGT
jgi:hypothetical protein